MLKKLLLVLCCFSLLVVGCAPTEQRFRIVFAANLNGNQDLYRAQSPDFKNIEQLTFTPVDEEKLLNVTTKGDRLLFYVPVPSPERIMSESLTPPANYPHTYIFNLITKTSIDIGYPLGLKTPTLPQDWSIDENKILLSGGGTNKVYTVNTDGKNVQEFHVPVSEGAYPVEISYSPDGKQIVYTENSNFSGVFHLVIYTPFIYDFRTGSATRIGDGLADCYNPQWSSAGNQILLTCNLSTDGVTLIPRIRLFDIETGGGAIHAKEIVALPCIRFAWSPAGKQFVAYCKMNDDPSALFVFNSDGSIDKEFSTLDTLGSSTYISEISWSPDGQKILYIAGKDENSLNIYMMDADGLNNHAITTQPSNYSELSTFVIP